MHVIGGTGGAFGRRPISSGSPRSATACSAGQLVVLLSITTLLLCSNYLLRFSHQRFRRFGCTRVKLITVKYHNYAKTNEVSALSVHYIQYLYDLPIIAIPIFEHPGQDTSDTDGS